MTTLWAENIMGGFNRKVVSMDVEINGLWCNHYQDLTLDLERWSDFVVMTFFIERWSY